MKLWSRLYGMIWLVFLEVWLAFTPIAPPVPYYAHIVVGLLIVGASYSNFEMLRATEAPGRIKRIARATFGLSLLMVPLGLFLYSGIGVGGPAVLGVTIAGGVRFFHFINAIAILTQAAAVAIAYDMWEDREFLNTTHPGEVPPAPTPSGSPTGA
ncbi:MAG: hypothetical protein L3K06_04990 [Thermoplasmata archaeon]|nr:hypothetical protein [Thermoplasmata archaeon]MCI4354703.1 hypothetical protein [Thermoplasmata archaeon]